MLDLASGMSVLFVDDDRYHLDAVAEIVSSEGVVVRTAASGADALQQLTTRRPDVLVVDASMADMNGDVVIRRARASYPDLPVVLLTGYPSDSPAVAEALAAHAVYLPKPVNIRALLRLLATLVRRS